MKARTLIEKYKNLKTTKKVNEEEMEQEISPVKEAIKWLKEKMWSESNDEQEQAADQMKTLAESDDEEANKFMEYMDSCASKYEEMEASSDEQEVTEEEESDEEDKEDEEEEMSEEGEESEDEEETEDEESEMEDEEEFEDSEMEDEESEEDEDQEMQAEKYKKKNW